MTIADVLFIYATIHPYLTALVVIVVFSAPFALLAHRREEVAWEAAAKVWADCAKETAKVVEELRKMRDRQ